MKNKLMNLPLTAQIGICVALIAIAGIATVAFMPNNSPDSTGNNPEPTKEVVAEVVPEVLKEVAESTQGEMQISFLPPVYTTAQMQAIKDQLAADSKHITVENNGYKTVTDNYGVVYDTNDPGNPYYRMFHP